MTNLVKLLNSKKAEKKQVVNVMLTCGKLVLINKDFDTSNFEGGLNEFTKVVNQLTKPFKDAPVNKCLLTFDFNDDDKDVISFSFLAGKFAPKLTNIVNAYVQNKLVFNTDKEAIKSLKTDLLNYLTTNVNGFIKTLEFINVVEKTPLHELFISVNTLKVESLKPIQSDESTTTI
jgi:hypothetical protein